MAAHKQDDVVAYIVPDFSKASQSVEEIVPGIERSIKFLSELSQDDASATGTWQSGEWMASCDDIALDAWSLCCHCFLAPRNFEAMVGGTCLGHLLASYFTCCLAPCYRASIRKEFRAKYNIQGSAAEDLVLSCCCAWCIGCQEAREAGIRSNGAYTVPFTTVGKPAGKAAAAPATATAAAPAASAATAAPAVAIMDAGSANAKVVDADGKTTDVAGVPMAVVTPAARVATAATAGAAAPAAADAAAPVDGATRV